MEAPEKLYLSPTSFKPLQNLSQQKKMVTLSTSAQMPLSRKRVSG